MAESFDPYRKWLGIGDPRRPPHHYRLLGLELFEADSDVISNAADRQMAHVRTFQTGPYGAQSQELLNELARARVELLDPARRAAYDQRLRAETTAPIEPMRKDSLEPPPVAEPISRPRAGSPLQARVLSSPPPLPKQVLAPRPAASRQQPSVLKWAIGSGAAVAALVVVVALLRSPPGKAIVDPSLVTEQTLPVPPAPTASSEQVVDDTGDVQDLAEAVVPAEPRAPESTEAPVMPLVMTEPRADVESTAPVTSEPETRGEVPAEAVEPNQPSDASMTEASSTDEPAAVDDPAMTDESTSSEALIVPLNELPRDPILRALAIAKNDLADAESRAREKLLAGLEKKAKAAADKGNHALADHLNQQAAEFQATGKPVDDSLWHAYLKQSSIARPKVYKAYEQAIRRLIAAERTDESATLRLEYARLRAPQDASAFRSSFYKFFAEKLAWDHARDRCEQMGGHLATLTDEREHQHALSVVEASGWDFCWMGASAPSTRGPWHWIDGSALTFEKWGHDGPDRRAAEGARFMTISTLRARLWHKEAAGVPSRQIGFLCEWD